MTVRVLCLIAVLWSIASQADDMTPSPSPSELGRFVLHRAGDLTARLDSATGISWYLCANKKSKQAWCRTKDIPSLPSGPVGRYRLTEGAPTLLLVDSVTGRSWIRCDMPTPEKGLAWCALED